MKIYMKLSKKEVRLICLTNSFWEIRKARRLLIVVLILTILATLSIVILNPANILFAATIVGMVAYIGAVFAGIRILKSWYAVYCYWQGKTRTDPEYIETSDEGISCFSNDLISVYPWSTVLDVYETKNFYFIATSKELRLAIPRRCFADQSQMEAFVLLLNNNIEKKRLHMKNYPVGVTAPDFMEEVIPTPPQEIMEEILEKPAIGEELFALRFTPRAKDFYGLVFWQYFTSKIGIQMTIAGLLLLALFFATAYNGSFRQGDWMIITLSLVILIAGLFCLLFVPIQIVFIIIKGNGKKSIYSNEISYQFYKDSFLVGTVPANEVMRVYWKDLVKINESPQAFFLYDAKNIAHIIPKRAFTGEEEKKKRMKALLYDARKKLI